MLKKSINSANIDCDSRKRKHDLERLPEKSRSTYPGAVRSLRLWTFFSAFAFLFQIERATVR